MVKRAISLRCTESETITVLLLFFSINPSKIRFFDAGWMY
jgi:hypothetical protein